MSILSLIMDSIIKSIINLTIPHIIKFNLPFIDQYIKNRNMVSSDSKISGHWLCQYKFPKLDVSKNKTTITIESQIVLLKEKNNIVTGKTVYAKEHPEKFYGELSGRYLTGRYDNTNIDHRYHGAFQFIISNTSPRMAGKWIGFNRDGTKIETNTWRWLRLTSETNSDKYNQINDVETIIKKHNLYKNNEFI